MRRLSFRKYFEATDIFGFEPERPKDQPPDSLSTEPIKGFDVEWMMELLSKKSIGAYKPHSNHVNEMRWGSQPGAVKLEVDTGYGFLIQKLVTDKQGNPRWITKKKFQLNRNGYGGMEDLVAQEVFEVLKNTAEGGIDAPLEEYKDLDRLVHHIYGKVKRTAKDIFIPEGVKKVHDDAYIIALGVRGHGLEARNQQRVEQNQTMISYDKEQGTIRVTNYNVLSPVGGPHQFRLNQSDLDLYFLPSQSRDEIADTLGVYFKYY